jgi:tetratricopeptide (TPR) repeat protein
MAIPIGEAHIIVKAITTGFENDIKRSLRGVSGVGGEAGSNLGRSIRQSFESEISKTKAGGLAQSLREMVPDAERTAAVWRRLVRVGFVLQPIIGGLVGGIGALAGGLGALVGAAGGAVAGLAAVAGAVSAVGIAIGLAKFAFKGIGAALSEGGGGGGGRAAADAQRNAKAIEDAQRNLARVIERNRDRLSDANKKVSRAQEDLNKALREGREELDKIRFSAEQAALEESKAAIELEKAREILQKVQDLPPNNRARQEAELAYKQADLNLRRAQDTAADLATEQKRLSRLGVEGTDKVIDARQKLADAEENRARVIRDAKRDEEDALRRLQEALKAQEDQNKALGGAASAYSKLTKSQKEFVDYLKQIRPLFSGLREDVASGFLPVLSTQIQRLIDSGLVDVLSRGFTQIGVALGDASIAFTNAFLNFRGLDKLSSFFKSSASIIPAFGQILGDSFGSFLTILKASEPLTRRFVEFLESKSNSFANFLNVQEAGGELTDFFNRAGQIAADFGRVFGNIFRGLGQLIEANFAPGSGGDYLLQWLITATDKFANLDRLAGGQNNLNQYFKDASVNTQKVLSSIGALLSQIIQLGDNKAIGETFDILAEGAPALASIIEKGLEAAPTFARLVVLLTEITDKVTDTRAIEIFFEVLTKAAEIVNELLENELIRTLVEVIGQVAAFALALGTIYKVGFFAFKVIIGSLITLGGLAGKASVGVRMLGTAFLETGPKTDALRGKMAALGKSLGIGIAIAAVVSGLMSIGKAAELNDAQIDSLTGTFGQLTKAAINPVKDFEDQCVASFAAVGLSFQYMANDGNVYSENLIGALDKMTDSTHQTKIGFLEFVNGALFGLGKVIPVGTSNFDEFTKSLRTGEAQIGELGKQLGDLAKNHMPLAIATFDELAAGTDGSYEQVSALLDAMPEYKDVIEQVAIANGLGTDQLTLVNLAMGQGESATKILRSAMADMSAATLDASGKISGLASFVANYANEARGAFVTQIKWEEGLDNLTEAIQRNEGSLDITTEAGRRNQEAMQRVADVANEAAAAAYAQDGNLQNLIETQEANRQKLIEVAREAGIAEEDVEAYVDQWLATPEEIKTKAVTENIPESKAEVEDLLEASRNKEFTVEGTAKLQEDSSWQTTLGKLILGRLVGGPLANIILQLVAKATGNAKGGMYAYANGGIAEGIYKGRAGSIYKFAEPETRWEAFISGKPGQTKRNIAIWEEAGRRLGVLGQAENGALNVMRSSMNSTNSSSSSQAGGSADVTNNTNISITVNPSPGMDERELAKMVSRQIAYTMRKGSMS